MPAYGSDHPVVVEAILEGDETPEQAWSEMNRRMIAWHKSEYPQLYMQDASYTPPPSTLTTSGQGGPLIIDMNIERLEIAIDNAQSIDDLKFFKEQNPIMPAKLIDHYNKRLKELTNGQ